jgi:hypothetical protein
MLAYVQCDFANKFEKKTSPISCIGCAAAVLFNADKFGKQLYVTSICDPEAHNSFSVILRRESTAN